MGVTAAAVALYIFGSLYGIWALWALAALCRIQFYSKPLTLQKYLHVLVCLLAICKQYGPFPSPVSPANVLSRSARCVFCFTAPRWDGIFFYISPSSHSLLLGILDVVPGLLFYAIYLIFLSQW